MLLFNVYQCSTCIVKYNFVYNFLFCFPSPLFKEITSPFLYHEKAEQDLNEQRWNKSSPGRKDEKHRNTKALSRH